MSKLFYIVMINLLLVGCGEEQGPTVIRGMVTDRSNQNLAATDLSLAIYGTQKRGPYTASVTVSRQIIQTDNEGKFMIQLPEDEQVDKYQVATAGRKYKGKRYSFYECQPQCDNLDPGGSYSVTIVIDTLYFIEGKKLN